MGVLEVEGVTHWSIPVDDLDVSEAFYGDLLGLNHVGRLGGSGMSFFKTGDHNILLCERSPAGQGAGVEQGNLHHSFTVSPEMLVRACRIFAERRVPVERLYYRHGGYFPGRELYFFDPSGNRLELRDPTWQSGMPEPTLDDLAAS